MRVERERLAPFLMERRGGYKRFRIVSVFLPFS